MGTMFWLFLVLTTHFSWALSNIADKYILEHKFGNPYVYMLWTTLFGTSVFLLIPFVDFSAFDARSLMFTVLGSMCFFAGGFPYAKAVQIEEVTRINVWWSLQPIFGIFIGFAFGKYLAPAELAAVGILFVAAFLASLHAKKKVLSMSPALLLMMLSTFLFALYAAFLHEATQMVPFFSAFVVSTIVKVLIAWGIAFMPRFRQVQKKAFQQVNKSIVLWFVFIFITGNIGIYLNHWALSLKHASLVFAFEASQAIFIFIMAMLLHNINPALLQEEFDRENIMFKLFAIVLMIVGVLVLAFA